MGVLTVDEEGPGLVTFIAHTPEDIDFLLDEHARLLEENAGLQGIVDAIRESRQCPADEDG